MKNDYEYLYGKMFDEFSELAKCLMFVSFAAGTDDNVALTEVAPLLQNLSKDLTECYNHFVEVASIIFMKDDYQKPDYFSSSLSNETLGELHSLNEMDESKKIGSRVRPTPYSVVP